MLKRWMALLIVSGACQPQPAPQGPPGVGPESAQAHWWCVFSDDGYASNCERSVVDCESMRKPPLRRAGPCSPEPAAYCFRYVNHGLRIPGAVVNECAAADIHCEGRRGQLSETLKPGSVLGECELVK
jgi:hypothetical protein